MTLNISGDATIDPVAEATNKNGTINGTINNNHYIGPLNVQKSHKMEQSTHKKLYTLFFSPILKYHIIA